MSDTRVLFLMLSMGVIGACGDRIVVGQTTPDVTAPDVPAQTDTVTTDGGATPDVAPTPDVVPDTTQPEVTPEVTPPDVPEPDAPEEVTPECVFGDDSTCNDEDSCTDDACSTAGTCVFTPKTGVCKIDDECYDDGVAAELNACKVCDIELSVTDWSDLVCGDDNPCTDDTCDANSGCVFTNNDANACDDDDACSTDDRCEAGACVGTCECKTDSDCVGQIAVPECQRAVCSGSNTCVTTSDLSQDGNACSDGNLCLVGAQCSSGACLGGDTKDCSGATTGPCNPGTCDPSTGECGAPLADEGFTCDDSDDCTINDQCDGDGACVGSPKDCTAFDSTCTVGTCTDGQCGSQALEGQPCDSDQSCVVNATCTADGLCMGSWNTADPTCACTSNDQCDDGMPCTEDLCDVASGSCVFPPLPGTCYIDGTCYFAQEKSPSNVCQVCDPEGSGLSWSQEDCDDDEACTDDSCDATDGCIHTPLTTLPGQGSCDDGDPCTGDDYCQDGTCVGTCECKTDLDCATVQVATGVCETVQCIGYTCQAVPDETLEGTTCDTGDKCSENNTCAAGICTGGTPVDCSASDDACNVGACNPDTGGCENTVLVGDACSDSDACTENDVCGFDPADPTNQTGVCGGLPKDCSAFADACNDAVCTAGTCFPSPKTGEPCDDGEKCTPTTQCNASGECVGAWDPAFEDCGCLTDSDCNDGLTCTLDECSNDGECINTILEGNCRIGGACYSVSAVNPNNACQQCSANSKTSWQELVCDDDNACTDNLCDQTLGCQFPSNDSNSCSDGDPCSSDDACVAGVCVGTCECVGDADCTDPAPSCQRMACVDYTCVAVPDQALDDTACEDGAFCTTGDSCSAGLCIPGAARDCTEAGDGVCVLGVCNDATDACVPQNAPELTPCSDGNPCTEQDYCGRTTAGVCDGLAIDCSGLEDQCNTAACDAGACKVTPTEGTACDDGESCTLDDVCSGAGTCGGNWDSVTCGCIDDSICGDLDDTCNVGKCDVTTGECFAEFVGAGTACDDGELCTYDDTCVVDLSDGVSGTCEGVSAPCSDGFDCTADICDGLGGCSFDVLPDTCLVDGACFVKDQENPANPCETCQSGTAFSAVDDTLLKVCNDGVACTQDDICVAGGCEGVPYTCDFDAGCQTATCNGNGTCTVTTSPDFCFIDGQCVASGAKNPNNECTYCRPTTSQTAYTNGAYGCDDGDACTKDDTCSGGSCVATAFSCSDGKGCTEDICDGVGGCSNPVIAGSCLIGGTCYSDEDPKPGVTCQFCDASNPTNWSNRPGPAPDGSGAYPCNDGLSCTSNDACNGAGACVGDLSGCEALECENPTCNASGGCDVELKEGRCKIDGQCYIDGEKNPQSPCQRCDASNPTVWTNLEGTCDDGDPCTDKDVCTSGACKGVPYTCNDDIPCTEDICDGAGGCDFPLIDNGKTCLIGSVCYTTNQENPSAECQWCQPQSSTTTWTNKSSTAPCTDDGLSCTSDLCSSGSCVHSYNSGSGECLIGGTCYANGANSPSTSCQYCVSGAESGKSWSNRKYGFSCESDGEDCTSDICNGVGTCTNLDKADWTSCTDGSSSTTGDWCFGGTCQGFNFVDRDVGLQTDRFIDATPVSTGVYGFYRATETSSTNVNARKYEGGISNVRVEITTAADGTFNDRYFDVAGSDSVGMADAFVAYSVTDDDWSTSYDPTSQFKALSPNMNFSSVGRTGLTLEAAGWNTSESLARMRRCTLFFLFPSGTSWSCIDDEVQYATRYKDCAGAYAGQTFCNYYSASTDEWPSSVRGLKYDSAFSTSYNYRQISEYYLSGNTTRRGRTVSGTACNGNSCAVVAGTGGLFFVAEYNGLSDLGEAYVAPTGLTNPDLVNWEDSTVWDGRVWVVGRRAVFSSVTFTTSISIIIAHAATDSNLKSSSSWKHQVLQSSATGLCLIGQACASTSNFGAYGVAGWENNLYVFGNWYKADINDLQDARLWRWVKQ